jgi:hypothetical protein
VVVAVAASATYWHAFVFGICAATKVIQLTFVSYRNDGRERESFDFSLHSLE